ncbi:sialate O-acetylesterase [Lutibacter sp. A64]|uniref:sialate O-acetylesterase n=1 Tax=Lutibacter sp. A64 TaxID=2918526 RepID=UPI001F06B201|nr:sialate O-acetylesterase [Lutibacter sp. A64]UMB54036.1 sialate O-acetylesterase [Lutibacter sp. A64]
MKCFYLIFTLLVIELAIAQVTPNSLFQNNMVLQRNQPIAVFGKAVSEKTVEIIFKNKLYSAKVKDGYWKVFLDESEAGGPFTLTIRGNNEIVIKNILVGEVWLCSGQSNMEMPVKGNKGQPINGSNLAILKSGNSKIRFFKVGRKTASKPLETCEGEWSLAIPSTVKDFSATAYFYGKLLQETLGVPIGLISSSWGGTPAEAWTPKEVLDTDLKEFTHWKTDMSLPQKLPSQLYNGMIHPLKPYTIKGVIWYQGEANKTYHQSYTKLFSSMIKSWRTKWNQGDFPFYFVQIAPLAWGGVDQAFLREKQLRTMLTVPKTGMAVTLDIGEEFCIHPAEKQKVGERLALWALAKDYGFEDIQFSGPVYKSIKVKEGKVTVEFDYAPNGVTNFGKEMSGFQVAGDDKIFHEAEVKITKGILEVWSKNVSNPIAVRYGWDAWINGSIFNTAGLPASSFRSDDWEE